jgi:hypothetical protein
LISFIKVDPSEITDVRLDRLLKLLSFQKNEYLTQSDFEMLLKNVNNYNKPGTATNTNETFKKTLGGGLINTSDMHDWKMACT